MASLKLHLRITGKVQGVWYRAWFTEQAQKRGLNGWVRNVSDGSVEAVVAGPEDLVEAMVEAAKSGPPLARVAKIDRDFWSEPLERGFSQKSSV